MEALVDGKTIGIKRIDSLRGDRCQLVVGVTVPYEFRYQSERAAVALVRQWLETQGYRPAKVPDLTTYLGGDTWNVLIRATYIPPSKREGAE